MWYRDTCSTDAQFSILNHDDNHQRNALRFNNNHRQRRRQWQRQGFRKLFKNVEHVCILCRFKLNRNSNTFNIDVNVGKLQFGFPFPKLSSSFIRVCLDRIVVVDCVVIDYVRIKIHIHRRCESKMNPCNLTWLLLYTSTTPPGVACLNQKSFAAASSCLRPPSITAHFLT